MIWTREMQTWAWTLLWSLQMLCGSIMAGFAHNLNKESDLIDYLLEGYNRQSRPTRDLKQPINVTLHLFLSKILDLEETTETLVTYMWMDVMRLSCLWWDELLQWNASDWDNITSVTLLPTQIWLPDFGVYNSAEKVYHEDHLRYFRVSLQSSGKAQWHPGGIYITSCPLDVTYFPFDTQVCPIGVQNWEYDAYEQIMDVTESKVHLDKFYRENGEWAVVDSSACKGIIYSELEPPLGYVKFSLKLQRKAQYSVINVIAPIVLLSLMDLLVFWLPPESGEKVSLGITVLLSFSVFLLVVDERMPRTSDTVPLLTAYLSSVMGTTGISLFVTVVILHLHHKSFSKPVPVVLARLLCLRDLVNDNANTSTVADGVKKILDVYHDPFTHQKGTKAETNEPETNHEKQTKNVDEQWKAVVARLDLIFFFLFLIIFCLCMIIMVFPYDTSVTLEREKCDL